MGFIFLSPLRVFNAMLNQEKNKTHGFNLLPSHITQVKSKRDELDYGNNRHDFDIGKFLSFFT